MTLLHLVDDRGTHWLFPATQLAYMVCPVVDGSQPVRLYFAGCSAVFEMPLAQLEALLGNIPIAIAVTLATA